MGDNVKSLKKENNVLREQVDKLRKDLGALEQKFSKFDEVERRSEVERTPHGSKDMAETIASLEFLSKEYDDLAAFRASTKAELQRINANLTEISLKTNSIAEAVEQIQQHSYQYNVKIVGMPQMREQESAQDTALLCLNLFQQLGVTDATIQDIDMAHRVPNRRETTQSNPIICKFVRRLTEEKVMSCRRNVNKVNPVALGFPAAASLERTRVYDHLTPKIQRLLYEAKRYQQANNLKYCWAKNANVYLRADTNSRAIKINDVQDLDKLAAETSEAR